MTNISQETTDWLNQMPKDAMRMDNDPVYRELVEAKLYWMPHQAQRRLTEPFVTEIRAADGALARIHSRGAHLTHWQPAGGADNRLFVGERTVYAEGVPIRGGVPVIFPQFAGEGPLPKHGFARTARWRLEHQREGEAQFSWASGPDTEALWPHRFAATLTVKVGGDALTVTLRIHNLSASDFTFTAALHTYLAVQNMGDLRVLGLKGCAYRDTARGGVMALELSDALAIDGEVDRNYFSTPAALTLQDGARILRIEQAGFTDTVVWNPGAETSAKFKDLAADEYLRFVCIEAATIQHPVALASHTTWQGIQRLSV